MKTCRIVLGVLLIFPVSCKAASQYRGPFSIENSEIEVCVDPNVMTIDVVQKGTGKRWFMRDDGGGDLLVERDGRDEIYSFRDFRVDEVSPIADEEQKGLEFLIVASSTESVRLYIRVTVSRTSSDLTVEVDPIDTEGGCILKDLFYPRAHELPNQRGSYAVVPMRQGCILPWDWEKEIHGEYTVYAGGENLYMPWWGLIQDGDGFIAILETPDDVKLKIDFSPWSLARIVPHWLPSMGRLNYRRKILYHFEEDADHVSLAKYYRGYLKKNGQFVSLRDKLRENPRVQDLLGTIIAPMTVCTYDRRVSPPEKRFVSFEETTKRIARLKEELNVEKAVIHLDGWGARGYDNLHPDPFPPCERAGGWEGLKRVAEKAEELGYLFALHDNYRDFYLDAPSFSDSLCLLNREKEYPIIEIWAGGPQSTLCPYCAMEFVKRNFETLENRGIPITASYLDVFTAVPLEECYNPRHRVTRTECREFRSDAFRYLRSLGLVVSSEEGADWGIPWLDFLYHAPAPELGVPVPLFSIVYHDAVVMPWAISSDKDYLRCILYGSVPIVAKVERALKNFRLPSELHREIGSDSLVSHRFLSADYTIQECTFGSGARVWVDFNRKTFDISGVDGLEAEESEYISFADIEPGISKFEYLGGGKFEITYRWVANTELREDFFCFAHFLSDSSLQEEGILFNVDHDLPIPTSRWAAPSEVIDGPYPIDWPFNPGEYELVIGLYDSETRQRLPLRGRDDGLKRILLGSLIVEGNRSGITDIGFVE